MLQDVALAVHETSENIKIHSAHDVKNLSNKKPILLMMSQSIAINIAKGTTDPGVDCFTQ